MLIESKTTARNRRRFERVAERFPAALLPPRPTLGGRVVRGEARDYDAEGLCFESAERLEPGRRVRVAFRLPASMNHPFRGMAVRMAATVRVTRESGRAETPYDVVVQWNDPLQELVAEAVRRHTSQVALLIVALIASVMYFKWTTLAYFWFSPFVYIYSLLIAGYFLSRFLLAAVHRNPPLMGYTPSISVVISVRNEEEAISRTLDTCFGSDYPPELLEVIVANDGSTDRTAEVLEQAKLRYPNLKVFTLPPSGKRHAMAAGVRHAAGEIIVFVDSDTFLFPTALRHIVCGFEDRTLGAVAGHTEVENAQTNTLTALQDVRYYLSFKLMKTAESVFGMVTCCPGCLSAYRKEYLVGILDPWLNQTFLGAPATFGDDRSLTNYILKDYRIIYNEKAICMTLVPDSWKKYLTQQVRWKKSWLRETLRAAIFMRRKHPLGAFSFYVTSLCSILSPLMCVKLFFFTLTYREAGLSVYFSGLIAIALLQCLYVLQKRPHSRWLLGGAFMVVAQIFIMGPQTYYAIMTMRKNHWGTR